MSRASGADSPAPFILASSSPRRRQLLDSAGFAFDVMPSGLPEAPRGGDPPQLYVRRLATDKALDVAKRQRALGDGRPVLAADTTVVLGDDTLDKPPDRQAARQMLERLSGRTHHVVTGLCVIDVDGAQQRQEVTTEVRFRQLQDDEIDAYLDGGEWVDKAGGYGIQGRAAHMVQAVAGSYTNVVGLPLSEAVEALRSIGVKP